jgi:heterodisulfide reductase subunit C
MPALIDTLRHMSAEAGLAGKVEPDVKLFHESFLKGVRTGGRLHELGLILQFNIRSKHFMKDAAQGVRLFIKGKVGVLPERAPQAQEAAKVFSRVKELEARSHEH